MRFLALFAVLACVSCAHGPAPLPRAEPVLSPQGTSNVEVTFIGFPFEADKLYVCLAEDTGAGKKITCTRYEYFMQRMQEQYEKEHPPLEI